MVVVQRGSEDVRKSKCVFLVLKCFIHSILLLARKKKRTSKGLVGGNVDCRCFSKVVNCS